VGGSNRTHTLAIRWAWGARGSDLGTTKSGTRPSPGRHPQIVAAEAIMQAADYLSVKRIGKAREGCCQAFPIGVVSGPFVLQWRRVPRSYQPCKVFRGYWSRLGTCDSIHSLMFLPFD
jgi:hypothetical protein